jgi:hypothetical protein
MLKHSGEGRNLGRADAVNFLSIAPHLCGSSPGCFRGVIERSLNREIRSEGQPVENEVQQFVDIPAAVIAGNLLAEVPPHPLDRVGLQGIDRQEVQAEAVAPALYVGADLAAALGAVEDGVVAEMWITLYRRNRRRSSSRWAKSTWRRFTTVPSNRSRCPTTIAGCHRESTVCRVNTGYGSYNAGLVARSGAIPLEKSPPR